MLDPASLATTGLALGLLHSLEPDHLAAMSTLVGSAPRRAWREGLKGVAWAAGHLTSLGAFGGAAFFLANGSPVAGFGRPLEALVGGVLVALGLARLREARRGPHRHRHAHGVIEHDHVHLHPLRAAPHSPATHAHHSHAAVWLGLLHGLAGSGTLLVVLPAFVTESAASYLVYLAGFGLGSMLGMGAFCLLLARVAAGLRARSERAAPWFAAATGCVSFCVGAVWLVTAVLP